MPTTERPNVFDTFRWLSTLGFLVERVEHTKLGPIPRASLKLNLEPGVVISCVVSITEVREGRWSLRPALEIPPLSLGDSRPLTVFVHALEQVRDLASRVEYSAITHGGGSGWWSTQEIQDTMAPIEARVDAATATLHQMIIGAGSVGDA